MKILVILQSHPDQHQTQLVDSLDRYLLLSGAKYDVELSEDVHVVVEMSDKLQIKLEEPQEVTLHPEYLLLGYCLV